MRLASQLEGRIKPAQGANGQVSRARVRWWTMGSEAARPLALASSVLRVLRHKRAVVGKKEQCDDLS